MAGGPTLDYEITPGSPTTSVSHGNTQLDLGKLTELDVETTTGRITMVRSNHHILCALTTRQSNLGMIRVAMSHAIKELSETA